MWMTSVCFEAGIGTLAKEGGGDEGAGCRVAMHGSCGLALDLEHLELGLTAAFAFESDF